MMGHFDVKHLHGSKSPFVLPYSEDDQYQNETSWWTNQTFHVNSPQLMGDAVASVGSSLYSLEATADIGLPKGALPPIAGKV